MSDLADHSIRRHAGAAPPEIRALAEAAQAEGHRFVQRTLDEWRAGDNRFDAPGEAFLLAVDGPPVGMAGLNIDPFLDDPEVGRLRHLYVHPDRRRQGIGRSLVEAALARADGRFRTVRLRTFDLDAAAFYVELGFHPIDEPDATHLWVAR